MPTGSPIGQGYSTLPVRRTPASTRLQALNETPDDRAEAAARQRIAAQNANDVAMGYAPTPINSGSILANRLLNIGNITSNMQAQTPGYTPPPQQRSTVTGTSGARRGGGGGAAVPKFTQAQLDWAAQLMQGARPNALSANTLDLPDYQGMAMRAFDPTMWNTARTALGEGYNQDIGTAQGATSNMLNFLNTNYRNPFTAGPQATMANAPGMDAQAMGRLLQGQGVNAYENPQYQQTLNEGRAADTGLSSLFAALGGNEEIMQRNRLANAQQYGTQATDAITAARRAGDLGLNLGQGQAQSAWQQAADQRAYQDYQMQQQIAQQEAQANWERQNQIQDVNSTNTNSYNNSVLSALLGMLPQLQTNPNLSLPTLQSLGLA
jgi:hypothetical protein